MIIFDFSWDDCNTPPGEIRNNGYAKFWGVNKVRYTCILLIIGIAGAKISFKHTIILSFRCNCYKEVVLQYCKGLNQETTERMEQLICQRFVLSTKFMTPLQKKQLRKTNQG